MMKQKIKNKFTKYLIDILLFLVIFSILALITYYVTQHTALRNY